jgi:hypothetical protein
MSEPACPKCGGEGWYIPPNQRGAVHGEVTWSYSAHPVNDDPGE